MAAQKKLTVLGIGNILMQDDGVGVRVMERVRDARDWPDSVEFIDGGAGGLNLLNVIEDARRLCVFDSAEMNLPPGEHRVISPDQVSNEGDAHRTSMHDAPFIETLTLCGQFFRRPEDVRILAIQPACVDYGLRMTDTLSDALPTLAEAGAALVEQMLRDAGATPDNGEPDGEPD